MFATIGHQIFNRDYRHIVLLSELDALRRAGHGAIVIGQLAQHACRFKASRGHEVDSGFSVAAAGQYAARLRTQREDVTGRLRSEGFAPSAMAARTVVTRSAAETPVVTPSAASMVTVKPVP